jgi:hypothetical protein
MARDRPGNCIGHHHITAVCITAAGVHTKYLSIEHIAIIVSTKKADGRPPEMDSIFIDPAIRLFFYVPGIA